MKLAIIYHSETGNTEKAAEFVKAGMEKVEGVEVATYSIKDVTAEDIADVKGIVFGAPTYIATCSWQMVQFMETAKMPFADKLGAAFSTANFTHGGSEMTLNGLNTLMLAKGMVVYSGGVSHGMPMSHIGQNAFVNNAKVEDKADALIAFGEKFAKKAVELF
ncbi:MAG: flavodoxin family protein [Oscillospiraceae bacterium]|nr:flavodoxin family protein [Oscillospiraceae bacterium]